VTIVVKREKSDEGEADLVISVVSKDSEEKKDDVENYDDDDCSDFESGLIDPAFNEMEDAFEGMLRYQLNFEKIF